MLHICFIFYVKTMTLDEILTAIEWLAPEDMVPVLEVVTAKLAEWYWYADAYAAPVEEEMPAEEMPEELPEELPEEEMDMWRLSL